MPQANHIPDKVDYRGRSTAQAVNEWLAWIQTPLAANTLLA